MRNYGRLARALTVSVLMVGIIAVTGAASLPAESSSSSGWARHPSGLLVRHDPYVDESAVPADFDGALGDAQGLTEANRADFAPPWFDASTSRVILGSTSARGAEVISSLKSGDISALSPSGSGIDPDKITPRLASLSRRLASGTVAVSSASYSLQALEDVRDKITAPVQSAAARESKVWAAYVDAPNDRVIASMDRLTDAFAAELVDAFGTDVLAVEVREDDVHLKPASRQADYSSGGFYGGAKLSSGCTDAFSWHSGTTSMMLTAAHCYPSGGPVSTRVESMGSITSGSRENWSSSSGTVYLSGQSVYRGDMALVQVSSGKTSTGRIY